MARSHVALLLLALYFAARLPALTALPVFLDESWHISWSMWIAEGKEWEVPWQYGKGLSVFVNALLFPWARDHYLAATRLVTVLFGAVTLAAVFGAARRLYDRETAVVAALFYVFCPFALFHDRLTLTDPIQSTFTTLSLLWSVRLAQEGRARDAIALAAMLVLSVFSKVLGLFAFLAPALALPLLAATPRRRLGAFLLACSAAAAVVAYPLWRFVETTQMVRTGTENAEAGPVDRLLENTPLAWEWISSYWTLPLLALFAVGLALAVARRSRPGLFLSGLVALPLLAFVVISAIWLPRYLVFLTPPLAILAAATLVEGVRWSASRFRLARAPALLWLAVALALGPALRFDYLLWTDPPRAPLPEVERFQFVDGWPSGYGVRDTIAFFKDQLRGRKSGVRVVLHATARRTTTFALSVAFRYEGWFVVDDLRFDDPAAPATLAAWAREMPTFAVVPPPHRAGRPDLARLAQFARLVKETRKPDGSLCDQIYELCLAERCGS